MIRVHIELNPTTLSPAAQDLLVKQASPRDVGGGGDKKITRGSFSVFHQYIFHAFG